MEKVIDLANKINRGKVGRKYSTTTASLPTATTIPAPSTIVINRTLHIRRYCSVCGVSSSNNKTATFTTVATVNFKITPSSTNNQRKINYTQAFRRKIYLNQLVLKHNKNKKYIHICNKHEVHCAIFDLKWHDKNNQEQIQQTYLRVPIDTSIKPTRSVTKNTETAVEHTRKRKNNNDNNIPKVQQPNMLARRKCNFCNCSNSTIDTDIKLSRIQPPINLDIQKKTVIELEKA
jgi:hypothetical protein